MENINVRIFVTDEGGVEYEITDLYWFEENGVHTFDGEGSHGEKYKFRFEFILNGKIR